MYRMAIAHFDPVKKLLNTPNCNNLNHHLKQNVNYLNYSETWQSYAWTDLRVQKNAKHVSNNLTEGMEKCFKYIICILGKLMGREEESNVV